MINIEITGGELFLEKNYKEILNALLSNGFDSKISTKIPLSEKAIMELSQMGLKKLQFSIDCLNQNILKTTLGVKKGYIENILKTISFCKKYDIKVKVNTIVTKHNCEHRLIDNMLFHLLKYDHIYEITISYAGYSINNKNAYFKDIAPTYNCVKNLFEKIREKYKNESRVIISDIDSFSNNFRFKEIAFFDKPVCSGNLFQFYLLPDGKVTFCEELYWYPKFILGDLSKQSIMEMWQGKKALDFYNITQKEFLEDSAYKSCKTFDYCHKNAAVCWKEIMETYGKDKWYYPDPRCPKAPKPKIKKYLI